jgi:ribosome-binding protein aMBF1 (putative translation factor)
MNKYDGGTWEEWIIENMGEEELERIRKRTRFASFLIRLRNKLNLSQKDVSELSGVKQPMIARIESGKVNVRVDTLNKMLKPLGYKLAIVKEDYEDGIL